LIRQLLPAGLLLASCLAGNGEMEGMYERVEQKEYENHGFHDVICGGNYIKLLLFEYSQGGA